MLCCGIQEKRSSFSLFGVCRFTGIYLKWSHCFFPPLNHLFPKCSCVFLLGWLQDWHLSPDPSMFSRHLACPLCQPVIVPNPSLSRSTTSPHPSHARTFKHTHTNKGNFFPSLNDKIKWKNERLTENSDSVAMATSGSSHTFFFHPHFPLYSLTQIYIQAILRLGE